MQTIIDGNTDPHNPWASKGVTVEHQKNGVFVSGRAKFDLYISPIQERGGQIPVDKLLMELSVKGVSPLNANILDLILNDPTRLPKGLKGKIILFPGTIYVNGAHRRIRYLYWGRGLRQGYHRCHENLFSDHFVATYTPAT